jgi:hypothetical protein
MIPVPDFPAQQIRNRARSATVRARARVLGVAGAVALVALGVQMGIAAKVASGVQVWLSGTKAAVAVESFTIASFPRPEDVRAALAHAAFPVRLPSDLPAGAHILRIMYAPADRPTFITLQYYGTSGFDAGFSLVDTSTLGTGTPSVPGVAASPQFRPVGRWTIDGETVLLPPALDAHRTARIEAAMRAATPAQSLAANESLAWGITVLGGRIDVAVRAERLAGTGTHAVLLDRGHLRWIPELLAKGRPMVDGRVVELTHVPYRNGEPDYAHATLAFRRTVAVPIAGMRAIVAALRAAHTPLSCTCEVLVEHPSASLYRVRTIPFAATAAVTTADVTVPGFAVRPER